MSEKNDGGPAFPQEWSTFDYQGDPAYCQKTRTFHSRQGMSLRDWFAGQIAPGLLSCPTMTVEEGACFSSFADSIAEAAGGIADAMLAERNKRNEADTEG